MTSKLHFDTIFGNGVEPYIVALILNLMEGVIIAVLFKNVLKVFEDRDILKKRVE